MTPQISVVVPTFRRTEPLRRCLVALLSQSVPAADYEIVVVDDDDRSDAVDRLVHELQQASLNATAGYAPTLVYLRPRHGCGPAVARNCGWRAARGRLIAFIDDDTVPHPRWLELGRQAMQQNRSWSASTGSTNATGRCRTPSAICSCGWRAVSGRSGVASMSSWCSRRRLRAPRPARPAATAPTSAARSARCFSSRAPTGGCAARCAFTC